MTDEELAAVREYAGDLLIRAFRGEVDLATGLAELRDLSPADLAEVAELPEGLEDDGSDLTEEVLDAATATEVQADLDAALAAVADL